MLSLLIFTIFDLDIVIYQHNSKEHVYILFSFFFLPQFSYTHILIFAHYKRAKDLF